MSEKRLEVWQMDKLTPYKRNARRHPPENIEAIMESIRQCGNRDPIEVDEEGVLLAGHGTMFALRRLGFRETEVVVHVGMTDEQKRKYRFFHNDTQQKSEWDVDMLAQELDGIDMGMYEPEVDFGMDDETEVGIGDEPEEKDGVSSKGGEAEAYIVKIAFQSEAEMKGALDVLREVAGKYGGVVL